MFLDVVVEYVYRAGWNDVLAGVYMAIGFVGTVLLIAGAFLIGSREKPEVAARDTQSPRRVEQPPGRGRMRGPK